MVAITIVSFEAKTNIMLDSVGYLLPVMKNAFNRDMKFHRLSKVNFIAKRSIKFGCTCL